MQKKLLLVLLIILSALLPDKAKASHAAGGEIIYQYIDDSTYRVIFKFYRDCTGIDINQQEPLCIENTCAGITTSVNMDLWPYALDDGRANGDPLSAGCSNFPNVCQNPASNLPGYREWWYYTVVSLTGKCDDWKFSVSISGRNPSINIGGGLLYIETGLNNLTNPRRDTNSSPYFSMKPIPYVCINQPFVYNNGAIDPNGDSLVTDIIEPMNGACGAAIGIGLTLGKVPPLSIPGNPFQTNSTFMLNSSSGQMNFTAGELGAQTLTTRVTEYCQGIRVGYIMRDVQVQVLQCTTTAPGFEVKQPVTGGSYIANVVNGCVGQKLEFDFVIQAADTELVLIAEDNHTFAIPTATINYFNQKSDSVAGHFSWTPTAAETGSRNFLVTAKDSTCKPPGIMLYYVYSVPIYIWPPVKVVPDTSICPGQSAFLNATGGGDYVWTVQPGGSPISSLNNPNIAAPVATPDVTTTYVVTSTLTAFCPNNSAPVTVTVMPGLNYQKLLDVITCPDDPVTLDLKINPPAGATYTAKWKPGIYLNDSTSDKPIATLKNSQIFTVILESDANICKSYDTVLVDVLTGFKIENPDTAICLGQSVQVRTTGDTRYNYSWTTTSPVPGAVTNPSIKDPLITPSNAGNYKYILKASYPSCTDSIGEFSIDVQPIPSVTAGDDAIVCFGDTMQLNGTVTPAGYPFILSWTPGASLNNANIEDPIFTASATTNLTFKATTTAGCEATDDILLTVNPADFLFANNDTAICPGNNVQLHLTGNAVKSMYWYPEVNISDKFSYDPVVSPLATQTYMAIGVDENACTDTEMVKVTVNPQANVTLPDSVTLYPGQSYNLDPIGNAMYYTWFPNVGLSKADVSNPIAKPDVNTRYYVTAITEFGCSTTDSIDIIVAPESILTMPNAFTPGAAPNDLLKVIRLGDATLKRFTVYNRWGNKLFETANINEGWNGTYKNEPQPMGVYIYTVEAVTPSGRTFQKQGNVTLVR